MGITWVNRGKMFRAVPGTLLAHSLVFAIL